MLGHFFRGNVASKFKDYEDDTQKTQYFSLNYV